MRRTECSPTWGYIAYKGYISMEEVMNGGQSNHMVMGVAFTTIIQAELKCKQTGCEADPLCRG